MSRLKMLSDEDSEKEFQARGRYVDFAAPGICNRCTYKVGGKGCTRARNRQPTCCMVLDTGVFFGWFVK